MAKTELTLEQAVEKLQKADEKIKELTSEIQTLKSGNSEYAKELKEAGKSISEKESTIEKLQKEATQYKEVIEDMQTKLDNLNASVSSAPKNAKPIVSHKGKQYMVMIPNFSIGDVKYNANDLQSNPTLVEELISKKSEIIKLVEPIKK